MLKYVILTNALFVAIVSFAPKAAFGLPFGNINNSPTSLAQNSYPNTVIVSPGNSYPTGTIYPNSYPNTVIVSPGNSYPTGAIYPNSYPSTVIVSPGNSYPTGAISPNSYPNAAIGRPSQVNPPLAQPSCGGTILGSSIPSPVPVNPYTGHFCR